MLRNVSTSVPENTDGEIVRRDGKAIAATQEAVMIKKLGEVDLNLDSFDGPSRPVVQKIGDLGTQALGYGQSALVAFDERRAMAHAHSTAVSNRLWEIERNAHQQDKDVWSNLQHHFKKIDPKDTPEEVERAFKVVGTLSETSLAAQKSIAANAITRVEQLVMAKHNEDMMTLERFDADVAGFMNVMKNIVEIEKLALEAVRNHQIAMAKKNIEVMVSVVDLVLKDRAERRKDVEKLHSLEQARMQTQQAGAQMAHSRNLENKQQNHTEVMDIRRLDADDRKQKRADDIADKRVELEQHVARYKHELEMCRENARKPSFWSRLIAPFRFLL